VSAMRQRISALPFPLAVVVWLNLVLGLLSVLLIVLLFSFKTVQLMIISIGLALFTVAGILQKSRAARTVVLLLSGIMVVFWLGTLLVGLAVGRSSSLIFLIPAAVHGVNFWGLASKVAREYFGIHRPRF